MDRKIAWAQYGAEDLAKLEKISADYKEYLDLCKTEREAITYAVRALREHGYISVDEAREQGVKLTAGTKLYAVNHKKAIAAFQLGRQPLEKGMNILGAHIDSPRLDLKPHPLYEDGGMAYFKTHYYGGIRKYQWVTIPLQLRGVVALKSGDAVPVVIGEGAEPKLVITDLLPPLGAEQTRKPLGEAIPAETLNILLGSRPIGDADDKERVKLAVMDRLHEKYGITEDDFVSAELEAVPAADATDIGIDASLIGAYGHDDRVCAFAELAALLALDKPEKTAVCIFADKEEIGSEGVSGMQGDYFEYVMASLCHAQGVGLRECLAHSFCLSADVTAAYDPNFSEVYERRNSAYANYGIGLCKYTGSGGKGGASDASAEVVGKIRKLFNDEGVIWQMAELGKTDAGGGGTVAKYMAKRNIDTLDAGVPVLSMHAPFETVAKLDCYMTYRGMKAIFEKL